MNVYYAQVGEKLAAKFTSPWYMPKIRPIIYNIPVMNVRFVDCKEVSALINSLNDSKSSQLTGITSRKKVKFKNIMRKQEKILKSPMYRGIKLWDMIPEDIQRSLTKVKFKRGIHLVKAL